MTNRITTVRDVVAAMGGTGETADFLEVVDSAVSNWKRAEDGIPRSYHLKLKAQLEARGFEVDAQALGWLTERDCLAPRQSKRGPPEGDRPAA